MCLAHHFMGQNFIKIKPILTFVKRTPDEKSMARLDVHLNDFRFRVIKSTCDPERISSAPKNCMSTSPTLSISEPGDVFERLAACQGFLTARDVAKMLSISKKTVYSYVSRNMIPHYKIEANVRFRPLELAEWLRKRACFPPQPFLSSGRPAVH